MGSEKCHEYPKDDNHKSTIYCKYFELIMIKYKRIHGTSTNMATPIKIIHIMVRNCKTCDTGIKPEKTF